MDNQGVGIVNGERIKGFVKIELFDKDGNKKIEKENLIVPGGKTLMFRMSASEILINGGNAWGLTAKQGVHLKGPVYTNGNIANKSDINSCLTNVLLNLTEEQKAAMSSDTNFINMYSDDFGSADKVVAYANMDLYPAENGKIGTPDYASGADIVGRTLNSVRYKYKDGVGTGTINAIAMAPFPTTQKPYGLKCNNSQYAPGYRIAKCIDRVNVYDNNFKSFSTGYVPPGINGLTTDEEIISNYSINGVDYHKINLVTGEVSDFTDTNNINNFLINNNVSDYIIIGDYFYTISQNYDSTDTNFVIKVCKISTRASITSFYTNSTRYGYFAHFLKKDDNLYITIAANYTDSANLNMLQKLSKGSNEYYSSVETSATTYAGILTVPTGINEKCLGFGHYGDKYIMYVSQAELNNSSKYCTGYIFTDINNIVGSIVDSIPSLYKTDIPFGTASVKGVLSVGICRENSANFDSFYNSYTVSDKYNIGTDSSSIKSLYLNDKAIFYSPDKSWSNIVSVVVLDPSDIIDKQSSDSLYVSYGYKIV